MSRLSNKRKFKKNKTRKNNGGGDKDSEVDAQTKILLGTSLQELQAEHQM